MKKVVVLFVASLLVSSCENVDKNLHDQNYAKIEKVKAYPPPVGAVPILATKRKIDYSQIDVTKLVPPFPIDSKAGARGNKLFGVYCSPCHGMTGNSDTVIAKKMDMLPVALTSDRVVKELKDAEIFVKILASDSLMPKYRAELEDNEAWEIVAYVRELQKAVK